MKSIGNLTDFVPSHILEPFNVAPHIATLINKIVELGFLGKLKGNTTVNSDKEANFEVRRILKAFVDAQWLAEFDERLAGYKAALAEKAAAD